MGGRRHNKRQAARRSALAEQHRAENNGNECRCGEELDAETSGSRTATILGPYQCCNAEYQNRKVSFSVVPFAADVWPAEAQERISLVKLFLSSAAKRQFNPIKVGSDDGLFLFIYLFIF